MTDIEQLIRDHLGADDVGKIAIRTSENSDGEPVVWIDVVLKDSVELSGETMSELTDAVWKIMAEAENFGFPVIDYVTQTDFTGEVAA